MKILRLNMKKLLLGFALLIPCQLYAADDDSVYSWGAWAQGIKPAAGPAVVITPAPVDVPKVDFRPNENSAFNRSIKLPSAPAFDYAAATTPQSHPGITTVSGDVNLNGSNPGGAALFNP
jgi:hypothetical protein